MAAGMAVGFLGGTILGVFLHGNLFASTVYAILIGLTIGFITGIPVGLPALIDGMLSGMMGGMMGAMLGDMVAMSRPDEIMTIMGLIVTMILLLVLYTTEDIIRKQSGQAIFSFLRYPFYLNINCCSLLWVTLLSIRAIWHFSLNFCLTRNMPYKTRIFRACFRYAFNNFALIATMTVLRLISTAPTAGLRMIPTGARTPAASGIATML